MFLNGGDIITTFAFPGIQISLIAGYEAAKDKLADKNIIALKGRLINAAGRMKAIFFDKTGTLTTNRNYLDFLLLSQTQSKKTRLLRIDCTENSELESKTQSVPQMELLLKNMASNNTLIVKKNGKVAGDSMEKEIFRVNPWKEKPKEAESMLSKRTILFKKGPHEEQCELRIVHVFPFDSYLQRMSVLVEDSASNKNYVFTKGAPEKITKLCKKKTILKSFRREYGIANIKGFRTLAFAMKEVNESFEVVLSALLDTNAGIV